jgi:uncharacterized protein
MRMGRWVLAGWMVVGLAGCLSLGGTTPPTRFFLLSVPGPSRPASPAAVAQTLQLPTVTIPGYLDRPQLVTRSGAGELHIAPFARWAEPLAAGITRVLGEALRRQLPTWEVIAGESQSAPAAALRLQVEVERCEGNERTRQVELRAHWRIEDATGRMLARGSEDLTEPWEEAGVPGLVASYDRLLARFGEVLAVKLAAAVPAAAEPPGAPR